MFLLLDEVSADFAGDSGPEGCGCFASFFDKVKEIVVIVLENPPVSASVDVVTPGASGHEDVAP